MIRYMQDWGKHPSAIVDVQTTNTSFLEMAVKFRDNGVANWGMILALHNPELQGVDPYAEDLTVEQKILINNEARDNIWYFLREILYLPSSAGKEAIRYRANRGNIAVAWLCMNNMDFIHTQPRQTGKSVGMDAINLWLMFLRLDNSEISLITKDNSLRVKNIERLKNMRDLLPGYMVVNDKTDKNNSEVITYNVKDNEFRTSVAQASEGGARKIGRGNTTPIFQIDEAPFITNIEITMASALPGGSEAKELARSRGEPHFTAITTTAGKRDDRDGKYIYGLVEESARWNDNWYDLPSHAELVKVVSAASRGHAVRVYCCFNHIQLGRTDEWLARVLAETGSRGAEASRDFLNEWTNGSQRSPLSVELNAIINKSEMTPLHTDISPQGYSMRWYIERDERREYLQNRTTILSMDTSEAIGNDDIGIVLTDTASLATVAASTVNDTNLDDFADYIASFLINNPNVTLMFERKSTGLAIFDRISIRLIAVGEDPFKRVFNNIVQQPEVFPAEYDLIRTTRVTHGMVSKHRRHFGFVTNADNRRFLFSNILQNNAKLGGSRVRDEVLVKQILGLVEKNNRIDHSSSGHDDMVIAWLLAGWMLSTGHNLTYYGIDPVAVLHDVHVKENETHDERVQREKTEDNEQAIEELCLRIADTTNPLILRQLEGRLRRLVSLTNTSSSKAYSISSLMEIIESQRKMKKHITGLGRSERRRSREYSYR